MKSENAWPLVLNQITLFQLVYTILFMVYVFYAHFIYLYYFSKGYKIHFESKDSKRTTMQGRSPVILSSMCVIFKPLKLEIQHPAPSMPSLIDRHHCIQEEKNPRSLSLVKRSWCHRLIKICSTFCLKRQAGAILLHVLWIRPKLYLSQIHFLAGCGWYIRSSDNPGANFACSVCWWGHLRGIRDILAWRRSIRNLLEECLRLRQLDGVCV